MSKKKIALITGITGQDGSYLAELLISKNYEVHGIKRRTSLFNTDRIDHLYQDPHQKNRNLILHHGDLTDSSSLIRIIKEILPNEIYNLAAQSHVAVSFEEPEYTANTDAIESRIQYNKNFRFGVKTKFYQASTSELYEKIRNFKEQPLSRSPYGVAKPYAFWTLKLGVL